MLTKMMQWFHGQPSLYYSRDNLLQMFTAPKMILSRVRTLKLLSLKAKLVSKVFDQMEAIEYNKLNHIIKELIKIKTKTTRTTVIKCLVGFFSNESQFRQSEEIEDAILGVINLFIRQTQVEAEFGKTVLTIFGKAWATKKY